MSGAILGTVRRSRGTCCDPFRGSSSMAPCVCTARVPLAPEFILELPQPRFPGLLRGETVNYLPDAGTVCVERRTSRCALALHVSERCTNAGGQHRSSAGP